MTADGVKSSVPHSDDTQSLPHFDTFLQETGHRSRVSARCISMLSVNTSSVTWTPACPESLSIRNSGSPQCGNTFESGFVLPDLKALQLLNSDSWTPCCSVPPVNINISCSSDLEDFERESSRYNTKDTLMPPGSELSTYETIVSGVNLSPQPAVRSVACLSTNSSVGHSGNHVSRTTKRTNSVSPLSTENFDLNTLIRTSPTSLVPYVNGSRSSASAVDTLSERQGGSYGHLSVRNSGHHNVQANIPEISDYGNYYLDRQEQLQNVNEDFVQYADSLELSAQRTPQRVATYEVDANTSQCQDMKYLEEPCVSNENAFQNHIVMSQNLLQQYEQEFFTSSGLYHKDMPDGYDTKLAYLNSDDVVSMCPQYMSETPSEYVALTTSYDLNDELLQDFGGRPQFGTCDTATATLVEKDEVFCTDPPIVHQNNRTPSDNICKWIDCSAVCMDRDELVRHIEKAHIDQRKGDDFTCFWQGCPRRHRAFNARYKLLIHMRVHSGEKPNKCTFKSCGKAFSRLENLKIHLRSHTGERPYHCQYPSCIKAFSNSSDRAKHQRTHLDTKPYACQIPGCSKRYTDPSSLRKHVKNHGTIEQQGKKRVRGSKEMNVGPSKPSKKHLIPDVYSVRLNSTGCSGCESQSNSSHDGSPRLCHQVSAEDEQLNWNYADPELEMWNDSKPFLYMNDIFDIEQGIAHLPNNSTFDINFDYDRNHASDQCLELDNMDDVLFGEFLDTNI